MTHSFTIRLETSIDETIQRVDSLNAALDMFGVIYDSRDDLGLDGYWQLRRIEDYLTVQLEIATGIYGRLNS